MSLFRLLKYYFFSCCFSPSGKFSNKYLKQWVFISELLQSVCWLMRIRAPLNRIIEWSGRLYLRALILNLHYEFGIRKKEPQRRPEKIMRDFLVSWYIRQWFMSGIHNVWEDKNHWKFFLRIRQVYTLSARKPILKDWLDLLASLSDSMGGFRVANLDLFRRLSKFFETGLIIKLSNVCAIKSVAGGKEIDVWVMQWTFFFV